MSFADKLFGKRRTIDAGKVNSIMAPTQGLVSEQLGISRQLMDPNSTMNLNMRNMLAQRAAEGGAQTAQQMAKMGAMGGMSPAQAMMQARMAMNQQMGNVGSQYANQLGSQFSTGLGLMGSMTDAQRSLNVEQPSMYVSEVNAANARRNQRMGMASGLLGSIITGGMGMPGGGG